MSASTQTVAMIGIAGRTNSDEFSAGQPWYSFFSADDAVATALRGERQEDACQTH